MKNYQLDRGSYSVYKADYKQCEYQRMYKIVVITKPINGTKSSVWISCTHSVGGPAFFS